MKGELNEVSAHKIVLIPYMAIDTYNWAVNESINQLGT